jgi:hypothetical protein
VFYVHVDTSDGFVDRLLCTIFIWMWYGQMQCSLLSHVWVYYSLGVTLSPRLYFNNVRKGSVL